jgi:hypothetical protein
MLKEKSRAEKYDHILSGKSGGETRNDFTTYAGEDSFVLFVMAAGMVII